MRLVLDSYAFKVVEQPGGACVLHLQPLDDDRTPDGIPVAVMIGADHRDGLAQKLRRSGVRPASVSDLKGIAGAGERK